MHTPYHCCYVLFLLLLCRWRAAGLFLLQQQQPPVQTVEWLPGMVLEEVGLKVALKVEERNISNMYQLKSLLQHAAGKPAPC
jgi:hypothetical protein